jgi:Family of unknown function (DUF6461)
MNESGPVDARSYDWIEEWHDWGCCIALVDGLKPEEALRRLVHRPMTTVGRVDVARAWAERQDGPNYGCSIEATTLDGWTVIVESNGYQATLEESLRRLSKGTRAAVVYWSVNMDMSFQWAIDGDVVRHFDPLLYDNPGWQGEPLSEEQGLPFATAESQAAAMACAERLTGVRLTHQFLDDRAGWKAVGHHPGSE